MIETYARGALHNEKYIQRELNVREREVNVVYETRPLHQTYKRNLRKRQIKKTYKKDVSKNQ